MKTLQELFRLDGRTALITGGAGHLGAAIAETLAELGAHLVLTDRAGTGCEARAETLAQRFGVKATAVVADLASPDAAKTLVEAAVAFSGGVDIVVHNAAFTGASGLPGYAVPFSEQSVEAWEAAMRVNTTVAFSLVQQALPFLEKSGKGAVLMIGSIYGVVAPNMNLYTGTKMGNPAAYAASKAGLLQLVRYLSTVLAPKVRVNALSPGGIARGQPEAFQERYRTLTPLARMGEEVDAKGAVALLCSDAGAYITGQNLMVDGGWTAW